MSREFISTSVFEKNWNEMGLNDENLHELQNYIMKNPSSGDIIEGTGGAIKIRFGLSNKGKSGGVRIIYIDLIKSEKIYFLTCYPKSKKDNLSSEEKEAIKKVVKRINENERKID